MNKEKTIIALAITSILVLAGFIGAFVAQNTHATAPQARTGAAFELLAQDLWVPQTATSGLVALTASEQRVIATSTERHWMTFTASPSCTQGFYLSLANDVPATANNSQFVAASSSFEISPQFHTYIGSVRALSNGGTCNINVVGR